MDRAGMLGGCSVRASPFMSVEEGWGCEAGHPGIEAGGGAGSRLNLVGR